ncbi:hypothetical protein [Micromonospora sp. NBC_00617]
MGEPLHLRADRLDHPRRGVADVGREGLRSAMDDYTEARVMVLTGQAL